MGFFSGMKEKLAKTELLDEKRSYCDREGSWVVEVVEMQTGEGAEGSKHEGIEWAAMSVRVVSTVDAPRDGVSDYPQGKVLNWVKYLNKAGNRAELIQMVSALTGESQEAVAGDPETLDAVFDNGGADAEGDRLTLTCRSNYSEKAGKTFYNTSFSSAPEA